MSMASRCAVFCYLSKPILQVLELAFLDDKVSVIVQVLDDVVVPFFVVFENDGFDGRVAFDENSCSLLNPLLVD